eukprot:5557573-Pleurochrysis_carterae.AAC.1
MQNVSARCAQSRKREDEIDEIAGLGAAPLAQRRPHARTQHCKRHIKTAKSDVPPLTCRQHRLVEDRTAGAKSRPLAYAKNRVAHKARR